ncbi:MAG: T9SS type A sorting domain-containing protein [Bacteroidetes bacterium]|nr:T9SS type A sorting domain-containing protein [Bacteroidota bacterium]
MKAKVIIIALMILLSIISTNAQITWNTVSFKVLCADTNIVCQTNGTAVLTCTIINKLCCPLNCKQSIDSIFYQPSGCYITLCNPNGCFPSTTSSDVMVIGAYATVIAKFEIHSSSNTGNGDVRVRFENDWDATEGFSFHIRNNISTSLKKTSITASSGIKNYPNPFSSTTTIKYRLNSAPGQLVIRDAQGRLVSEYILKANDEEFSLTEKLTPGLYFYAIYSNHELIGKNKMIVE